MSVNKIQVRPITSTEHSAFLETREDVSFLQRPEWAKVKEGWRGESLGFFEADTLVGSALVLHRSAPIIKKSLAYVPDGPVIDFQQYSAESVLKPLAAYLRNRGAFQLKVGPGMAVRTYAAAEVRKNLGAEGFEQLSDMQPREESAEALALNAELKRLGFTKQDSGLDFNAGQPEYVARVNLRDENGEQLEISKVLKVYSSTTARQTRNALKSGLVVEEGGLQDIKRFHALYNTTADRQEFSGRPLHYFEKMYTALNEAVPGSCTLYIASFEGQDLASAIMIRSSDISWYLYGASTSEQPKLHAPKAVMYQMISDSIDAGCRYLDQGGVSATLDMKHHLAGLTKFKTSTGCDLIQTSGEWDLALNKPIAWAFEKYMNWRKK